jgi:hypothetical protein
MDQKQLSPREKSGEASTIRVVRPRRTVLAGSVARLGVGILAIVSLCAVIGTLLFASPVFAQAQQVSATSPAAALSNLTAAPNTSKTTDNWAGYRATGNLGTYRLIDVNFTVPKISNIQSGHFVSIWAGLGGSFIGDKQLVQAGVTVDRGSNGKQHNIAWWEIVPGVNGEQDFHFAQLNAGDHIHVVVSSNLDGNGQDTFLVEDIMHNEHGSKAITGHLANGAASECIVERPLDDLANFGTEKLSGCETGGVQNEQFIGGWPHIDLMMAIGNDGLAVTGPLTGEGTFTVKWLAAS